jgi:hypothetical protein
VIAATSGDGLPRPARPDVESVLRAESQAMFSRRKRERARDQAEHTFILLDGIERGLWDRAHGGESLDDDGHARLMGTNVRALLGACDGRPDTLTGLVLQWGDAKTEQLGAAGDDERGDFVAGIATDIGLNSIGNLFGLIPAQAPAYNEALAREGRRRGWRK